MVGKNAGLALAPDGFPHTGAYRMTTLLLSYQACAAHGTEILSSTARAGISLELLPLPADKDARLVETDCARTDIAFFSSDVNPYHARQFFSTVRKAPNLGWLHVFNAGVDHPIFDEMLARGVRLTTSSGTTTEPIAQTAITGLLMLARNFPRWLAAQRNHVWDPMRGADSPRELSGQTALIIGMGSIGTEIARLAKALGLTVIGVRRSPLRDTDQVDELHPPAALPDLLPRADWLILACPLTAETRGMIGAPQLAALPQGARVINVARGEIIDETALIAALRDDRLEGAYLDVFAKEPLPADSPLWNMAKVLITPHNSAASRGNDHRVLELFLDNLARWHRREALVNEVVKK